MAFNGSGTFNRLYSWVTDAANAINITASRMDGEMDGFATGLSNCITKDGQTTVTSDIPMNSNKITVLADPTNNQDAATKAYVDGLTTSSVKTIDDTDSPYTLLEADKGKLIRVNASAGDVTINLLAAATAGTGFRVTFKRVAGTANTITLDGDGTETIDGATTRTIVDDDEAVSLRCNGSLWEVDSSHDPKIDLSSDITGQLDISGSTNVSGDLAAADGGTGRSSHTAYAVICGGTTTTAAQQSIASVGTSGQILTSNGAGALPTFQDAATAGYTLHGSSGAAPGSGTTLNFGSLSGVSHFKLAFVDLDFAGAGNMDIVLGTSGGLVTTGYESRVSEIDAGTAGNSNQTAAIRVTRDVAGDEVTGVLEFMHLSGNVWAWSGNLSLADNDMQHHAGALVLGGELTQVELQNSDAFNGGGYVALSYI